MRASALCEPRASIAPRLSLVSFPRTPRPPSLLRLMQFAEREFERASRMLVPPEPHVATPHDQTFLLTIGTVGAGALILWLVDQGLLRYYSLQKSKRKAAKA